MRRRLKSGTEYPLTTAPGAIARNRGSEKPFDMRKAKRVRIVDTEMDDVPVYASSRREANQSPRSGAPKTSEYAYFRKVKNGAVHGHSRSLHKENEQLKSSKINYLIGENSSASDMLKPSSKDLKFSVSGERAGPSDHNHFLTPRVSKYDEPDQIRSKELTNKIKKRSSLFCENVTPIGQSLFSSSLNEASENSENQYSEKGIFSAKRHRLRQWVDHTLFSEMEKLHHEGFDLVSSLLSRLLPKGRENNNPSNGDADIHQSNNQEKGLHLSHKRDWDKEPPKICTGRSSEIVLWEWDTFDSGFPFRNYGTGSHVQDEWMDLDQHLKSRIHRSSHTQHDFSFSFPFERYRSSDSFHFKELDEFGSIIEHARDEPHRLLLEWDFELGKDRVDSSIINHDTAKNECARLATSWNVDEQQIVDNVLDTKGLCSSSLFSNYYLEFDSLPNYGSTGCLTQDFGPNFDDVECAMTEPGQLSLALPCTPKCITLAEDKNAENILYNSNIIFPHKDQHWLKNKVWDGKPQSDFWRKCLSAADFSAEDPPSIFHAWQFPQNENSLYPLSRLKEAPGQPFNPFSEGAFNHNFLSSNLQSSLDTLKNCPLLLNHFSQDRSHQELYFEDDDNELEYR
ncbi:hypothetical protein Pfo_017676 [Paulownia fortunei]|nr:hypothetical protein Pfo_017676 [Paulownia fortunei]